MAATAVYPAMNGDRSLHPFFVKPKINDEVDISTAGDETKSIDDVDQLDGTQDAPSKVARNGRAKKRTSAGKLGKTQKTLQEIVNPGTCNGDEGNARRITAIPNTSSDGMFSSSPRKRRRTSQTEFVEVDDPHCDDDEAPQRAKSPEVIVPASSPLPTAATESEKSVVKTPPKKMLRLNASGKFSSPIGKSDKSEDAVPEPPKRRGRPRKSKEADVPKQLIVVMQHKNVQSLGPRIDRIMSGEERVLTEVKTSTPKKQRTPRKQKPLRPTHPFFTSKPKAVEAAPKPESPRKTSAVTPGKLRMQAMGDRSAERVVTRAGPDYVVGSGLLKDRLMFKHPGTKEPAWPSKEQVHVRGLDETEKLKLERDSRQRADLGSRKGKAVKLQHVGERSLLEHYSENLRPEGDGDVREDGFRDPHPSLTLPQKHLIPGQEILQRISRELSVALPDEDDDELLHPTPPKHDLHPAIQKLVQLIPKHLNAFDRGRGETSSWLQKYEPVTAAEVLQPSREMTVLRDWLTSLTVTAVEGSSKQEVKTQANAEPKPKKRRRRKQNEMDDFLVDSDEDVHNMDELPEPEHTTSLSFHGRKTARSIVQTGGEGVKLSNAVLLSGSSGCGKTAAAYAVAMELGFKVFEISSSERRSGKDVVDRVGDMTENHLVKHHGVDTGELSSTEELGRHDEAFERDLASGRQGKMNAFFKPQAKGKATAPKKAARKEDVVQAVQKAIKKAPKDQQQSLILLEEVDVLFKDDKDFWSTVLKLIVSSKRPFIMTCNDEDLLPLQAMSLHAILRFSPPPVELATDYLLLIAAAEGHLLKRDAVRSLYQSKSHDLRTAIAELDFWCQIGIGDPRGGLSWIFQRYPPGSDLDGQGRPLRVVSEGTYKDGMGLLPERSLDDDTRLLWARREYEVEVADLDWEQACCESTTSLKEICPIFDAMSAADVYGSNRRMDTTQPPMPLKARSHYTEGMALLQTDELIGYHELGLQLANATYLTAMSATHGLSTKHLSDQLGNAVQTRMRHHQSSEQLTRQDFACFDAISVPSENTLHTQPGLMQSAFDGPLEPIATDIAPYVRSIVHYDIALAKQREELNSIIGEGRHAKRARTTRAARSALEGGQRASTRRERWFSKDLNMDAVLATAGKDWPKSSVDVLEGESRDGTETPASSAEAVAAPVADAEMADT